MTIIHKCKLCGLASHNERLIKTHSCPGLTNRGLLSPEAQTFTSFSDRYETISTPDTPSSSSSDFSGGGGDFGGGGASGEY